MGGLNTALSVATGALEAQEAAIQTTDNNISNSQTPGYSREIVNFSQNASVSTDGVEIGQGVSVTGITSVRDILLSLRIQGQTSQQSAANAQSSILSSVQTYFPDSGTSVGTYLSSFFTDLSALSSNPTNAADRQTAISDAQNLVSAFHSTAAGLSSAQGDLNTQVSGDVTQINQLAGQIATLNTQINQSGASNSNSLVDQRSELEQQLAGLTSIQVSQGDDGDTISTGNGTPLVVGGASYALSTSTAGSGLTQVLDSNGNNITRDLTGGDLGGTLVARDQTIPGFSEQLDTLANTFASAFNGAQAEGFDLSGNPGAALFDVPSGVSGSASQISLATTDGSDLAISSDAAGASNGNLANLTGVQNAGSNSPTSLYSGLVNSVGNAVSSATAQSTALQTSLTQLNDQQAGISGVSIDEESSNLIRFQQAYQAAAEVITTIDTLFTTTIDMAQGGV